MNAQEYSLVLISISGNQKTPNSVTCEMGVNQSTVNIIFIRQRNQLVSHIF